MSNEAEMAYEVCAEISSLMIHKSKVKRSWKNGWVVRGCRHEESPVGSCTRRGLREEI